MATIIQCKAGTNYSLGVALGNIPHDQNSMCWAVEVTKDTPGALEYEYSYRQYRYYRRFDDFKSAEAFALSQPKQE